MDDRGSDQFASSSKTCGIADFPAVLAKANEQSSLSRAVWSDPSPAPIGVSHEKAVGSFPASPGCWGEHLVQLELSDSLVLTTILRI
jgi:hypothetical protein